MSWGDTIRDDLKLENQVGGDLPTLPCPLCGLPRSQRSCYIRCQPCGVNWMPGENPGANPKIERYAKMVASLKSSKPAQAEAGR